jgi:hypothetical protein
MNSLVSHVSWHSTGDFQTKFNIVVGMQKAYKGNTKFGLQTRFLANNFVIFNK